MTDYKIAILEILRERALENTSGRVSAALDILGHSSLSQRLQSRADRVAFERGDYDRLQAIAEPLRPAFPAEVEDTAEELAVSAAAERLRVQEDLLAEIEGEIDVIADRLEAEISSADTAAVARHQEGSLLA